MASIRTARCLVALAALVAAGCASKTPSADVKAARSDGLVVCETQFMRTGPMEGADATCRVAPSRSAQPSEILTPDNPWIGTVGVATSLSDSMRCGLGIEIPNPSDRRFESTPYMDRLGETGVGAWVSFDF